MISDGMKHNNQLIIDRNELVLTTRRRTTREGAKVRTNMGCRGGQAWDGQGERNKQLLINEDEECGLKDGITEGGGVNEGVIAVA